MSDLEFSITATISGIGKDREGVISVDGQELRFSAPASMGGKGVGASPETLLISAVTSCYSLTLLAYLQKRQLKTDRVVIGTKGVVAGFPQKLVYTKITVNPVIHGGDPERQKEYRDAAATALDRCFIGQTVKAGGVAYELGEVTVV
jgi:peroxiredoxin-like protein